MTTECRPPPGTPDKPRPRCWFCGGDDGPICHPCMDNGDDILDAHFATPPEEPK